MDDPALLESMTPEGTLPLPGLFSSGFNVVREAPLVPRAGSLDRSVCTTSTRGSAMFFAPWEHNMYHFFAKNLYPLVSVLLSDTRCQGQPLPCAEWAAGEKVLYAASGHHKQLKFVKLLEPLFDRVLHMPEAGGLFEGGPHCFDHVAWGQGAMLLGFNESYHARDRVAVTSAVRKFSLDSLGVRVTTPEDRAALYVGPGEGTGGPEGAWDRPPVVLHLRRDPDKQRRWIETPAPMLDAWGELGTSVTECCDFRGDTLEEMMTQVSSADILWGLHGAGLSNFIFCRRGSVLVEVEAKGGYGDGSNFYTAIADARDASYVRVTMQGRAPNPGWIKPEVALSISRCGLALLRTPDSFGRGASIVEADAEISAVCAAILEHGAVSDAVWTWTHAQVSARPDPVGEGPVVTGGRTFEVPPCEGSKMCMVRSGRSFGIDLPPLGKDGAPPLPAHPGRDRRKERQERRGEDAETSEGSSGRRPVHPRHPRPGREERRGPRGELL